MNAIKKIIVVFILMATFIFAKIHYIQVKLYKSLYLNVSVTVFKLEDGGLFTHFQKKYTNGKA